MCRLDASHEYTAGSEWYASLCGAVLDHAVQLSGAAGQPFKARTNGTCRRVGLRFAWTHAVARAIHSRLERLSGGAGQLGLELRHTGEPGLSAGLVRYSDVCCLHAFLLFLSSVAYRFSARACDCY